MPFYLMTFSNRAKETKSTSNGVPFKVGDTVIVKDFPTIGLNQIGLGWTNINGAYKVDMIDARGLLVSGAPTRGWGQGTMNIPFTTPPSNVVGFSYVGSQPPYSSVTASGGAVIAGAQAVQVGIGVSADWWIHVGITTGPSVSSPPEVVTNPGPRPVIDPIPKTADRPPPDNGNNLNTVDGGFDIDKFIATANFKPGRDPRANARGIAAFRAEAKKAAKQARLTPEQTKKLMDAVEKAIADGMAKAKKKPLDKIKKR